VLSFQVLNRPALAGEAKALFKLALRYVEPRRRARLVITTGVMGVGKSTVARMVAARLGAIVIRTDAVRKRLVGLPLREHAAHGFGEGLYTDDMGRRTYAEAFRVAEEVLAAGWPVLLDGSFSNATERRGAQEMADRLVVPHTVLWCDAPDEVVAGRLRRRADDRHEVSDGREELLSRHRSRYEPPAGEPGVVRVDTADDPTRAIGRFLQSLL